MIPQVFQRAIKGLILALNFLTIAPLGVKEKATKEELSYSIPFYPIAGLLIGGILYVFYLFIDRIFPQFVSDALVLFLWITITGALHLDGLADTVDGLYAGRTRDEILRIMRDPHTGAIGTTGVLLCLILKFAGIHSLPQEIKPGSLLLVPAIARAIIIIPAYFLPYAREEGTGHDFVNGVRKQHLIVACIFFILFVLPFGIKGILLIVTNGIFALLFTIYLKKRLNGITGDCLGFLCESSEVLSLITLCAGGKN